MRHLALVVGIAGLVVAVWFLLATNPGTAPDRLAEIEDDRPSAPGIMAASAGSRGEARPAQGRRVVEQPWRAPKVGLEGLCEEYGEVGGAVYEIIRKSVGQDARTLDRRFAREDVHQILMAWNADPQRKDKDIDFLVRAWDMIEDPTARYALSWLFRRVEDDRVIRPLLELVEHHPWPAVDAIADQRSDHAARTLVEARRLLRDAATRNQATIRIARSGWEGAREHLAEVWRDDRSTDLERLVAVECLAHVPDDPESRLSAYELAVGAARPLDSLGRRAEDHPTHDLRSAAVMAVMHAGDQTLTRKLLEEADGRDDGDSFVDMVDLHVGTYQGADISRLLLDRVGRRRKVALGEARYFNRMCTRDDVARLRQIESWAASPAAQEMIQAAILNAATRD